VFTFNTLTMKEVSLWYSNRPKQFEFVDDTGFSQKIRPVGSTYVEDPSHKTTV